MKRTYILTYEHLGTPCRQETTDLRTFMAKLEEVEERAEVPNSSISFETIPTEIQSPDYAEYEREMRKSLDFQ